jgi:beta propeller repeat protein
MLKYFFNGKKIRRRDKMKIRKKLYSIVLALVSLILFLIIVSSTASASDVQSALSTITETRINTNGSVGYDAVESLSANSVSRDNPTNSIAAIYGDRIVWMDNRNGNDDIYMYQSQINSDH